MMLWLPPRGVCAWCLDFCRVTLSVEGEEGGARKGAGGRKGGAASGKIIDACFLCELVLLYSKA